MRLAGLGSQELQQVGGALVRREEAFNPKLVGGDVTRRAEGGTENSEIR